MFIDEWFSIAARRITTATDLEPLYHSVNSKYPNAGDRAKPGLLHLRSKLNEAGITYFLSVQILSWF